MRAFLLTDIEGSTGLWEEDPDAMGPALARHDALLRGAIAGHGGEALRTAGDAFTVGFGTVEEAVRAAVRAQRALEAEAWPTRRPLRVRMAIDVGEALDGPSTVRFGRLLVRGHGGQTLLSEAASRAALPPGAEAVPLGEGVYELRTQGFAREFPPLRRLFEERPVPTNLPAPTTSFVGREAELAAVVGALRTVGLLTLVGPGGTGKTRLALRAAAKARRSFPGGVWLVELAPLGDGALVESALAGAIAAEGASLDALAERLGGEPSLVVLDNCEHLLEAARRLVERLVPRVPGLCVLATSREPLGLEGERVVGVPPLSSDASVRLFAQRASAQRGDFALTEANRPVVAALCARLDGIPLAIELAAARVRSLSVEQIAARLDDRFRLLTGGSRAALPRQQTLRALVEWSHGLLNDRERTVFRRLAAFVGGWTPEDAAAVVAEDGLLPEEVARRLGGLADKSLLTRDGERYGMLETVRHYALERLREAGEEARIVARHGAWFQALAWTEGPRTRDSAEAMVRLSRETDNLRAAMDRGDPGQRLEMVGSLRRFWALRGMAQEARGRALAALREDEPPSQDARRVGAIATACALGGWAGDTQELTRLVREGIALAERLGEEEMHMTLLNELGNVLKYEGDLRGARAAFEEAVRVKPLFPPLGNLAILLTLQGDYALAERTLVQATDALRGEGGGSPYFQGYIGSMRGRLHYAQGRYERAEEAAAALLALAEEMGLAVMLQEAWSLRCDLCLVQGRFVEAETIVRRMAEEAVGMDALEPSRIQLAQVALARGEFVEAVAPLRAALASARPLYLPSALEAAARLLAATGRSREAAVLLGAASSERRRAHMPIMPVELPEHDRLTEALRTALGDDLTHATLEGKTMGLEAARALALAALPS